MNWVSSHDRDDEQRAWRIVGSKLGLEKFAAAISKFASNPRNDARAEHDHLGPYMYLEIGSWPNPEITDHWIAGPQPALEQLAFQIRAKVERATENDVLSFRKLYAPASPYELLIEVRPETFDPAKEDPECW